MKFALSLFLFLIVLTINAQTTVLYKGDSNSDFDIAYKIENGKVYHGNSSFSRVVYYTIYDNKVYVGQGTSSFNCLYTISFNY